MAYKPEYNKFQNFESETQSFDQKSWARFGRIYRTVKSSLITAKPLCKEHKLKYDERRGEFTCVKCGQVLDERVPDSRFSTDQYLGLQSLVAQGNHGRFYNGNADLRRAFKMDRLLYSEKRVVQGIAEIEKKSTAFDVPDQIKDLSISLFKKVIPKYKNKHINLLADVCLYYNCEYYKYIIYLEDLLKDKSDTATLARRYYRALVNKFKLPKRVRDAEDFIPLAANSLGLEQETETLALQLLRMHRNFMGLSFKNPRGLAAGCLYLACKISDCSRTQKDISKFLKISELTLRERFKEVERAYRNYH